MYMYIVYKNTPTDPWPLLEWVGPSIVWLMTIHVATCSRKMNPFHSKSRIFALFFGLFSNRMTQTLESAPGNVHGKWMLVSGYDMSVCLNRFLQWPVFMGDAMVTTWNPKLNTWKVLAGVLRVYNVQGTHKIILIVWIEQNLWCESKRDMLSSKLCLWFCEFFLTNMISKRKYAAGNSHQLLPCQACGGRNG